MWAPSDNARLNARWRAVDRQIDLSPCNGCDLCKIRCAEGVQMTRREYDQVRAYIGQSHEQNRIDAVVEQDKRVDLGDGVEVIMCRYLDMERGSCAVYEARPLVCRLLGHVEWMPCPVERIDRQAETGNALALLRAYSKEERKTFEQWDQRLLAEPPAP